MKLEAFFESFDQFADAPDAVAKMRELVLELAVQGRLVPQHAKEGTAHALLERVASTVKSRGRDAGESKDTDAPFPIPETWAWVRLPRVLRKLTDGTHHSPPNGTSGAFMYVTAKNIKTDGVLLDGITYVSKDVHNEIYSRCDPSFGDVLYIKDGATTGIATINQVKEPFSMLSSVALLKPSEAIFNRYLLWVMRSPFFYAETRGAMKGAAITRVTLSVMGASLLPLPPLAEQKRIVAKVDELMALCDRLEAQLLERETRHAALARASLARFADAPTPANLPFLFHPSYVIPPADLRKSIFTLAVQGKLVPQDPNDEPAEELIDRIAEIRHEIIAKQYLPVTEDEAPYEVPCSWTWVRLGNISLTSDSGWSPQCLPEPRSESDWGVLKVSSVSWGVFKPEENKALPPGMPSRPACEVKPGDFLISRANTEELVARSVVVNQTPPGLMMSDKIVRFAFPDEIEKAYVNLANMSCYSRAYYALNASGTSSSMKNVGRGVMCNLPIPLPPLAEQRRIVSKVEQLTALIIKLESQLADSQASAANLLAAVVAELTTKD